MRLSDGVVLSHSLARWALQASVREEIARVEQESVRLSDDGKVSNEIRMHFNTLLMIVNMLVVIFMDRSTKKISKKSSIPHFQTIEGQSSTTSGSNKKGLEQNDESFDKSSTVETEAVARANRCIACGENLSKISVTEYERRTRIDGNAQVLIRTAMHGPRKRSGYLMRLLKETCTRVSARKCKKLIEKEYANLQKRYRNILTRGIGELPARPERPSGKRGRLAPSDAQYLWDRMYEHKYAVLLFAYGTEVPFNSNRAEPDLQIGKVKQKVNGCFRHEQHAVAYCRISSYLQTLAYRGYNPLAATQLPQSINSRTVVIQWCGVQQIQHGELQTY